MRHLSPGERDPQHVRPGDLEVRIDEVLGHDEGPAHDKAMGQY